ncbi:DUF3445 domain-containing protein [bacterium]|nr:DUF3445 domain-containing protein [bacterium]
MKAVLWRLPGIQPLALQDWIEVDEAYAAQMAERARLMAEAADWVHVLPEAARPAAVEALDLVLTLLAAKPGFAVGPQTVTRPDGVTVPIDRAAPLLTLGALVQEDICLMQRQDDEHVLTAALLCFPASWTLAEKLGRPLTGIHRPVAPYDDQVARRVQRLFDAIRPEQPLWRMNAFLYADPALHQPKSEAAPRQRIGERPYLRAERQALVRLPKSDAVVFSIHTYVVPAATLSAEEHAALVAQGH